MKLFSKVRSWFRRRKDEPTDVIAALLRVAQEDPEFRRRLEYVLRLPTGQRESVVNTALREMALRGEPAPIRAGFALLATEDGAAAALSYLNRP